jgi:hypothetical protein
VTVAEAEVTTEEKKGGKKGLIIKIIPLLLIGLVVAKMTVLKPPPPTPQQTADKTTLAKYELETACALANEQPLPKIPKLQVTVAPTTTTTLPGTDAPVDGPVLDITSKTLNLDATHFLKYGLGVQLPLKSVPDDVAKAENWGDLTSQAMLNTFSGLSIDEVLATSNRERFRHQIGYDVCMKSGGKATTVYFTEFVAQ